MRLITLNLWGGIVYEPLIDFIKNHKDDTDIFCFQEMLFGDTPDFTQEHKGRVNLFSEIQSVLSGFTSYQYFAPKGYFQNEEITFDAGQAIFVKNPIVVKTNGGLRCYEKLPTLTTEGGSLTGSLQWIELETESDAILVANLHGLWQKDTKKVDTPERLVQSKIIKDFLNSKGGKKILCGDFNLIPDGKSITMLEEGMRNLIKESGVKSTRSELYDRSKGGTFADYILISLGVEVKNFKVLQDTVSDHLPVFLDFN